MAASLYTLSCRFVSRLPTGGQFDPRSALDLLSQLSHPFEHGAVRFLFWWLFLHPRLRSDNVGPACAKPFAPFSGSFLKGATRFYPNGSSRPFGLSSKAFRLRLRASIELTAACQFPLPCVTTSVADPFVGLEGRDPRDREVYTLIDVLDQIFMCFIFPPRDFFTQHKSHL